MTHDVHEEVYSKTLFGFWVYILTDFVMFATLFATYLVLVQGAPSYLLPKEYFNLPLILGQTLLFLCSSFTIGLGSVAAHRKQKRSTIAYFAITFFLGLIFLCMEVGDLSRMVHQGYSWYTNAVLSGFFTLVGTHILHLVLALLFFLILLPPVIRSGITPESLKRLMCLKLFWQFLNIIWLLIFGIVYLMEAP